MAVVQAQVAANGTPATPVELFEATGTCTVNIYCVNPESTAQNAFVEIRLQDAAQTAAQLLVPGTSIPPDDRIVEGPVTLVSGDTVFVYGSHANQVFHLYGHAE
jgi:hypothetical protein